MADDATETTTETTEATEPASYVFPFDVPAELASAVDEDLRDLHAAVREHAQTFAGLSPAETSDETLRALRACRDLSVAIRDELIVRADRAAEASDLASDIDLDLPEMAEPDDEEPVVVPAAVEPAPAVAVTAAAPRRPAPRVRDVARNSPRTTSAQVPQDAQQGPYGSLVASTDVPGYTAGQTLERFSDAALMLSRRMDRHPQAATPRSWSQDKRPITVYDTDANGTPVPGRRLEMRTFNRANVVQLRRDFPPELRVDEGAAEGRGEAVAYYAASEKRLPGGSLVESAKLAVKRGRSLTAAAGWCAPSETIYDLCELETLDGILDAPELQTTRGGWSIPTNGGPDFTSIWSGLGDAGDTHLSEAEVIAENPQKICTEIPCPPFSEVRLGVDYYCLTGSLLQRRGYPEAVARFARGAVIALAHKINAGFIQALVTGSGAAVPIGKDPSGDDAASSLLNGIELATLDIKYRNRMGFNSTVEIVLPWWVRAPIRSALSRRTGVALFNVTDAMILDWFGERGAVPRFVYDWQDAFSGLAGGPGGVTPLTAWPATVQFLAYPAGTWVRAVQDVVDLDTIYDSTLLATNQYTAIFTEDGWAALKMCVTSRLYQVQIDPSGVTGCCPGEELS